MLANRITSPDNSEKIVFIAVCGDASEFLAKADLGDYIDSQVLNPFANIKRSIFLSLRDPGAMHPAEPVKEPLVDH